MDGACAEAKLWVCMVSTWPGKTEHIRPGWGLPGSCCRQCLTQGNRGTWRLSSRRYAASEELQGFGSWFPIRLVLCNTGVPSQSQPPLYNEGDRMPRQCEGGL